MRLDRCVRCVRQLRRLYADRERSIRAATPAHVGGSRRVGPPGRARRAATRSQTACGEQRPSGRAALARSRAVGAEHDGRVVGRPRSRGRSSDLVDHQQVAALAGELGPAVVEHEPCRRRSRRRSRRRPGPVGRRSARCRPGCRGSAPAPAARARAVPLLDLASAAARPAGSRRPPPPSRPRRRRRGCLAARPSRSSRRVADADDVDAGRVGQRDVGRDQRDLGAAGGGGRRERVALPAGGAVAEVADRVERLAGAAGGDDDAPTGQVVRQRAAVARSSSAARPRRSRRLGQPARRRCRRRSAGRRRDRARRAPRARRVATLAPGGGVLPHLGVHRGREHAPGSARCSRVVVSRSSARPAAALASRSAVAGATTTRSALLAGGARAATSGRRSRRRSRPGGRTGPPRWPRRRSSARTRSGTTVTSWPASRQPAQQLAGLVGGDAAADARGRPRWRWVDRDAASTRRLTAGWPELVGHSPSACVSRPALISRSAIDSGFSWAAVSTSGPTYSSRPSPSWE